MVKQDGTPERMLTDEERELLDAHTRTRHDPGYTLIDYPELENGKVGWCFKGLRSNPPGFASRADAIVALDMHVAFLREMARIEDERRYDPWGGQRGTANG